MYALNINTLNETPKVYFSFAVFLALPCRTNHANELSQKYATLISSQLRSRRIKRTESEN